ncbi:aspartate aminotransferase family protein [Asticcacaulis sp. EMRT-3]|uniref:aspartate aminotransferase family protein n=1 Tax=Asticcacaulis sp. EMRT-3 TaxID=3040349 RepID=UPI0024AF1FB8|nr:aspartate aminotransferase family protein [Asticcacaulis sp. EMRT-3]MDI7773988.1 aspartate aminotransferase family protein [Asticcacaulis sp. EMRT-3]
MNWQGFLSAEREAFVATHPRSRALADQARAHWRGGVAFHWMRDWASPFPIYVEQAKGAQLTDADGLVYDDFCLGDTPSMFGHARSEIGAALAEQAGEGAGFMLPTRWTNRAGELLSQRFGGLGLSQWQVATTASDANRAAIRWARAVTQKPKILVFDGCYHGMVEDAFVALYEGVAANKKGLIGQVTDQTLTTKVIAFNDVAALEKALAEGDVAAVLAEPVMTNCGMIQPQEGFHEALRRLTQRYGSLLILDETHTLSSGPSGYAGLHDVRPDMLVIGKAIAGGVPGAVWGMTKDVASRMEDAQARAGSGSSGIGTTLSGNALVMRAIAVMLDEVMTEAAYAHMLRGAQKLVAGLRGVIAAHDLPWSVVHVGARAELIFAAQPPRDAAAMRAVLDPDALEAYHLYLINQAILIAPFHNMMLISPQTDDAAIERLVAATRRFAAIWQTLQGRKP